MADFSTLLAQEKDPRFARLSYEEQRKLRALGAAKAYAADPRFQRLTPIEQQTLILRFATRPPVYENPVVGQYFDGLMQAQAQRGAQAQSGRPTAPASPAYTDAFTAAFVKAVPLYQIGLKATRWVLETLGQDQAAAFTQSTEAQLYGRDGVKGRQYLQERFSTDAQTQVGIASGQTVGSLAGFGANFAFTYTLPMVKGAKFYANEKIAQIASNSKLRSDLLRGVLGSLAENTVESVALTASDLAGMALRGEKDPFDIGTVAELYKENALLDYAVGVGANVVLPFAKLTGRALRATFLPGGVSRPLKNLPPEELSRLLDDMAVGRLPKEVEDRLPAFAGDFRRSRERIQAIHADFGKDPAVVKEIPFWAASTNATTLGRQLGVGEDGVYRLRYLRDIGNNVDRPDYYRSLAEVNQVLAEDLAKLNERRPRSYPLGDYGDLGVQAETVQGSRKVYSLLPEEKGRLKPPDRDFLTHNDASALVGGSEGKAFLVKAPTAIGPFTPLVKDPAGTNVIVLAKTASWEETQGALKTAGALKAANPSVVEEVADLASDQLRRAGFDSALVDPQGTLVTLYGRTALKPLQETLPFKTTLKAPQSDLAFDAYVRTETSKVYKTAEVQADPRRLSRLLSAGGDLGPKRVGLFARSVLDKAGLQAKVSVKRGKAFAGTWNADKSALELTVPGRIGVEDRRDFAKQLFQVLQEGGVQKASLSPVVRATSQQLKTLSLPGEAYADRLRWTTENLQKAYGKPVTVTPDGVIEVAGKTFPNAEAAADHLIVSRLTAEAARIGLAEQGYRLVGRKGAYRVLDSSGTVKARGASLAETLDSLNWRPEKIPSDYLPEVSVVDEGVRFTYQNYGIKGSLPELTRYLDRFENYKLEEAKKVVDKLPEAFSQTLPNRTFEVVLPSAGIRETFDKASEASWFVRGGWAQYEGVKRVATRRGLDLAIEDGKYVAHIDGETFTARLGNHDELKKLLNRFPDPQTAPALLGEEIEQLLMDRGIKMPRLGPLFNPSAVPSFKLPQERFVGSLALATRKFPPPQTTWIQRQLKKTGHEDLLKVFDRVVDTSGIVGSEKAKWHQAAVAAHTVEGRVLPIEKRRGLRYYVEAKTEEARASVKEQFKLTEADLGAAERVRDVYGRNQADGLFGLFGIDPIKFQTEYMPRLRQTVAMHQAKKLSLEPEDIFKAAFPRGVPKELKFFAEMDRINDLFTFDQIDDSLELMNRYINQGVTKHHLNPVWREFDTLVRKKIRAGTLDPQIFGAINEWRESLMGFRTDGEKFVEEFSKRFAKRIGRPDSPLFHDILRTLFSVNVFSSQAWKPYNVVRNLSQIFTTLAPVYGNNAVFRAMQRVAKDPTPILAKLKELGVLLDTPPFINALLDTESLAGKVVHKGLAGITSSDALSRAIAYETGKDLFSEGLDKLQRGVLKNEAEFLRYVKGYRLSEGFQGQILDLARIGKVEAARDLYSREVVRDTMFAYTKQDNPALYRGFFGRMFGQYGVYSVQYIQNVRKSLLGAPLADKLAYLTRFGLNTAALVGAMSELGVEADRDFMPWAPAMFGGGPMFNLAVDLAQAAGQGFRAEEARQRIKQSLPVDFDFSFETGEFRVNGVRPVYGTPFTAQYRALEQAYKYYQGGDPWLAWLALTSTPIRDDLRQ